MIFAHKTLACRDCGIEFVFAAEEQQQYAQLGFLHEPKRCPACRTARKAEEARPGSLPRSRRGLDRVGTREVFTAVCSACGHEARLPFKPHGDRPVYCTECFGKRRG